MSWVEKEASRANRNLLIVNILVGAWPAYFFIDLARTFIVERRFSLPDEWWPMLIPLAVLALAMWNCIKAVQRYGDIQLAPIWKQVSAYSNNPMQISMEIEQELLMGSKKYRRLRVTNSWLIRKRMYSTWISPIGDLAWIYKKVTRHYTNGIPTGTTYTILIKGRHWQDLTLPMSEKRVDALYMDLATRVPWALFGHNPEIERLWKKDPRGFIAQVDARHQKYIAQKTTAGAHA